MSRYNHSDIAAKRAAGRTWAEIGSDYGVTAGAVRKSHARHVQVHGEPDPATVTATDGDDSNAVLLTEDDVRRIASLDDLIDFFDVDTEQWEVRDFRVNKWEQHSVQRGVVPLYQVRANLVRNVDRRAELLQRVIDQMYEDAREHAPAYEPVERTEFVDGDEPCLFLLAVFDPHVGMLAWGDEVGGVNQDHKIAVSDYSTAVDRLLGAARFHNTEKILFVVGNDLLHVDTDMQGGKGGATKRGTPQDVDTRRAKLFTAVRRLLVSSIDRARTLAPVEVLVVPGNHDEDEMYRMGEVLSAWFRLDSEVAVEYGPDKRKFYGYGSNAWMLTHGEEYKRKRDNLPLIFATECPAEIWTASEGGYREVLTGHNHIKMGGAYYPTSEVDETRAIRTRSLPGLTATDSWHHSEGYRHLRTATAIAYRRSGGVAGLYEFNP